MKTFFKPFLAFAILAFIVSSCKKDKDPEPAPKTLVGVWNIDSLYNNVYENGVLDTDESEVQVNFGTITLNATSSGMINATTPFGSLNFPITNWSKTNNTISLTVVDPIMNDTTTSSFEILIDQENTQRWFNAEPSKTNPNRDETIFRLTRK